jgi:hypothetical protein
MDTSDPSRVMMRQVAGSFAEYEKARLVAKPRVARERKRVKSGKCEGRKSWSEINPELRRYTRGVELWPKPGEYFCFFQYVRPGKRARQNREHDD